MAKKKLKPFIEAHVRMDGTERVPCAKCGKKCRYLANIGGDMVCKTCYEDFRKHFDESEKD